MNMEPCQITTRRCDDERCLSGCIRGRADPDIAAAISGLRAGLGMDDSMTPAGKLARRFHEAYERLAPSFGYETRPDTRKFDPATANGGLMVAVCEEILRDSPAHLTEAWLR